MRRLLPVAVAGIAAALFLVLVPRVSPAQSTDDVARTIRDIALRPGDRGLPPGGTLGPWQISAAEYDDLAGHFVDFQLVCGSVCVAARSARLNVDPEADTFSFELEEVVYTVLAPPGDDGEPRSTLRSLDRYTLGPAPYGVDIVDATAP
jgi:hypothetical protein